MNMIGLLGGMSWESTREYYRIINEEVRIAKGGLHSAPLLLHSFDFAAIAGQQSAGEWDALSAQLACAAQQLERGGARAILICTNYMHRCAEAVEAACSIPLLHIADAVADAVNAKGQTKVALLGAAGTMEHPFYRERLAQNGIDAVIPNVSERAEINRIIFEELCQGVFSDVSRQYYLSVIGRMTKEEGVQGIVLGCTEIEQLICQEHTPLALFPSARLHALAAVRFVLSDKAENTAKEIAA